MGLTHLVGDVRKPVTGGLIVHCVNDKKLMGSGVALSLYSQWKEVKSEYLKWDNATFALGNIQIVWVEDNLAVVNLIGQHGIASTLEERISNPPVRYEAIKSGFRKVCFIAKREKCDVHFPMNFGCDRAGGVWKKIEELINDELVSKDINVYTYKFVG